MNEDEDNNNNNQMIQVENPLGEDVDDDAAPFAGVGAEPGPGQQPSHGRPFLAIQDEEEWYRRHGLPPAAAAAAHRQGQEVDGSGVGNADFYYEWYGASNLSPANQREAQQRVEAERSYQNQVLQRFHQEDDHQLQTGDPTNRKSPHSRKEFQEQQRLQQLQVWQSMEIKLEVEQGQTYHICNLGSLATFSDTVYALANSYRHFNNSHDDDTHDTPTLSLALHDHSFDAVESFLKILFSLLPSSESQADDGADLQIDSEARETANTTDSTKQAQFESSQAPNDIDYDTLFEQNKPEHIIEYCQLAHYLQCSQILEHGIIPILIRSVDSSNCMSLCQLADQFHIPSLLEVSMNHLMRSLGSLEESDTWNDLTPELRERITCIRGILTSNNRKQLYFSSFTEYLAMFAEQVDYYKERLLEAKLQQQNHMIPRHSTKGWEYAQSKIDEQEKRVTTLKRVLKEQKRLFGKKDQH